MIKPRDSIAIAGICCIAGVATSCPLCIVASGAFLINGIRDKFKL